MRIGITGHQRLTDGSSWHWVEEQINTILLGLPTPLIGLTSLAAGTDQIFAEAILRRGGTFQAIIPFAGYEDKFPEGRAREGYARLLRLADQVEILKKSGTGREAYFQAGKQVVHMSESMVAVWDGLPAGIGGTRDVVAYAKSSGRSVVHIDPATHATRRIEQSE